MSDRGERGTSERGSEPTDQRDRGERGTSERGSEPTGPSVLVGAMGVPVRILVDTPTARDRLRHQWSRALLDDGADAAEVVDRTRLAGDPVRHDYRVTMGVTLAGLQQTAGRRINLHAGGVVDDRGRMLVLVGSSGTGKTTAVVALARRLGYLSDETVSLSPGPAPYTALPHAKPLSVVRDPARPRHKVQRSPDDLGLGPTPPRATAHRLVLLRRRRDGADGPRGLVPVGLGEALLEVIPQTSSLARLDDPLLRLTDLLRACGGAVALEYTEVDDHVDELVDLLATEPPAPGPSVLHHPGRQPSPPAPGRWIRFPWLDAVEVDGELLVMVGDIAHRLDGLAAAIWHELADARSPEQLVAGVQRRLGPNPRAVVLVRDALAWMADHSLAATAAG